MLWCFQTGYCCSSDRKKKKQRNLAFAVISNAFFFFFLFLVTRKEPVILIVPLPGPGTRQERVEISACSSECRVKTSIALILLSWHNSV